MRRMLHLRRRALDRLHQIVEQWAPEPERNPNQARKQQGCFCLLSRRRRIKTHVSVYDDMTVMVGPGADLPGSRQVPFVGSVLEVR